MCCDMLPTVVDIHNCTGHIVEGGKKDAKYLAEVRDDELKTYDTHKTCPDVFYFNGECNVQKIRSRLCSLYPRDYVFHCG